MLALLPLALLVSGARADAYDPVAPAAATVVVGRARLTLLSPHLFRFEVSGANATAPAFDDRATTVVVNRRPAVVPAFSVVRVNATAATVTTGALAITVVDAGGGAGPGDFCRAARPGRDFAQTTRAPAFPNGAVVASQAACCDACMADPECTAWVFAVKAAGRVGGDPPGTNCYPLSAASGLVNATDRVAGGGGGGPPPGISLSVAFDGPAGATTWAPPTGPPADPLNLNGTYKALDCYTSPEECNEAYVAAMGPGLISRSGWAFLDDTETARVVPAPDAPAGIPTWWDEGRVRVDVYDVYFNARGDGDHRAAIADWVTVLGRPAMLPRAAFGVWWSRYYPYTQDSIVAEVLEGYRNFSIPLNFLVFDMDWHNEPTDKTCESWGNFDVNTTKFPDMVGFAQRMHEFGEVVGNPVRLSFNTHPQTGVDHCDSRYAVIAAAMGVDPATNATVACDFGNRTFTDALFRVYFDASPLSSVDTWWTDYGGCGGPNEQLWSNRVFYEHQKYGRRVRGQAFSRYGGLGNHRAPHGFSGDTFQDPLVLKWEVKTTQTAANVLWGYWSHDIGGFHNWSSNKSSAGVPGDADPTDTQGSELLLRWVQFGAVAPILRTHCDHCERRIWLFPYFAEMRDAMRLRNALGPYIYTEARAFYDTGVAPVHPLYYDAPGDEALYAPAVVEAQYAFGSAILAAPITALSGAPNGTLGTPVRASVYLPAGAWCDFNGTVATATGGVTDTRLYGAGDIPLFVRGGALLPFKTMASVAGNFPDPLVWVAFPGAAAGAYALYEDDGDSDAYAGGEFVTTNATVAWDAAASVTLVVAGAVSNGALPDGFPQARGHIFQVRGARPVARVTANGVAVPAAAPGVVPGWSVVAPADHALEAPAGALVVAAGAAFSAWDALEVVVTFA